MTHPASLKGLNLDFDDAVYSQQILAKMTSSCHLPAIGYIHTMNAHMELQDLFRLLQACQKTLRHFSCLHMKFEGRPEVWLRKTLKLVRDHMRLQHLRFRYARIGNGILRFPRVDSTVECDDDDEEGYVWVTRYQGLRLDDEDEIHREVPRNAGLHRGTPTALRSAFRL